MRENNILDKAYRERIRVLRDMRTRLERYANIMNEWNAEDDKQLNAAIRSAHTTVSRLGSFISSETDRLNTED